MDPYCLRLILVVGEGDRVRGISEELRASLARRECATTGDISHGLGDVRAVICYPDFRKWRQIIGFVEMNMAETSPRQMAFVGFNFLERWVLRYQFLKLGMGPKPTWLGFFPAQGIWFHSRDERKIDIVGFLRRKPIGNGSHRLSDENVST